MIKRMLASIITVAMVMSSVVPAFSEDTFEIVEEDAIVSEFSAEEEITEECEEVITEDCVEEIEEEIVEADSIDEGDEETIEADTSYPVSGTVNDVNGYGIKYFCTKDGKLEISAESLAVFSGSGNAQPSRLITREVLSEILKALADKGVRYDSYTSISFSNDVAPLIVKDCKKLFCPDGSFLYTVKSIDLTALDMSGVTDMEGMFANCEMLGTIEFPENINTSKVTDMSHMFQQCYELGSIDLSSFDTSKVTNMMGMFEECQYLKSLDLSNFRTNEVTNMADMFSGCIDLESLNIKRFNTEKVTNMRSMFNYVMFIKLLDLSSFDVSNVNNMKTMFKNCVKLETIKVSDVWSVNDECNTTEMFRSCKQLKGGKGTRYSSGCVDGTYAVIDGKDGKQGYLTGANYVVFDFNGKSSNKKYRSAINDDNRVDKPTRYFEPSGYKLEGWYKSAACKDNEKWNFDTDTVTSNITLYAKWVAATPANDEKKGSEQKNNDSKGEDGKVSFIPENYADIYLRSDAYDLAINSKLLITAGKNVAVKWGKVKGADGYDVYMAYTGKDNALVKSVKSNKTSVKVTKLDKKKINQKKTVKCCVIAYKMVNGKKAVLAKSLDVKSFGAKNKKKSDVKSISLKKSVSSIKKKKSKTVKLSTELKNGKKTSPKNTAFKYASSKPSVATVNKKGKISAKKKGKCYIWIYAANGKSKKVKVTVK